MNGLVLIGGKSSRFGRDKSQILLDEKSLRARAYDLLSKRIDQVFFSCRPGQSVPEHHGACLFDFHDAIGPAGGLLAAYEHSPNTAWLVLACDVPLFSRDLLLQLIQKRNQKKDLTLLRSVKKKHGEPLLAIWEPSGLKVLQKNVEQKILSLQKTIAALDCEEIRLEDDQNLFNLNTPDDYSRLQLPTKREYWEK